MRSLPPPVRDVCGDLKAVARGKNEPRRKRLRRLQPHIEKRYLDFWLARGSLEVLSRRRWAEPAKDALEHCYTGATKAKKALLKEWEESVKQEPNLCPYCLLRQPKSVDHFLPKEYFPEYSVLSWNLVWVCDPCNRQKGIRLVDVPRRVINPYFDVLPESPLLHAEVAVRPNRVSIQYRIHSFDPAVPQEIIDLMRRHYAALGLEKDYLGEGSAIVSDIVNATVSQYRASISQDQLDQILDVRMREWGKYPVNSYRVAVVEALETCPDLLEYINQRIATAPRPARARPLRDLRALRAAAAARAAEI